MNRCVSPISVNFALSMYANAANGDTQREIIDVLGYKDQSLDDVNCINEKLIRVLPNLYQNVGAFFANSIWTAPGLKINEDFKETLKHSYYAQFRKINIPTFQSDVNLWCSENTNGMVTQFPIPDADALKVTMINTTYFKGGWQEYFIKHQSLDKAVFNNDDGSKSTVDFVEGDVNHERVYKTSNATIGRMEMGLNFSFVFILPDVGVSVEDAFASSVRNNDFEIIAEYDKNSFRLKFPKFKSETKLFITDVLTNMGCGKMFTDLADFSNMTDARDIVNTMQHIVSFEANEQGVKGGAATGGLWITGTEPDYSPIVSELILDRPFGYCVLDNSSGAVLFVGCVEHL